jgi:mRNA interferase RelE/StbE
LAWEVEWTPKTEIDFNVLPKKMQERIIRFLRTQVADQDNPRRIGMALKDPDFQNLWRYRVGDYRLLCFIDDKRECVLVVQIGRRDKIYKH